VGARIVDAEDGRPLAGVLVSTHGALTRTDARGDFTLNLIPHLWPFVKFFCEAKGYALREFVLPIEELPLRQAPRIELFREVPVTGEVVDLTGKPISGAAIELWVERSLINRDTWPTTDAANALTFHGITDHGGRFAIRGVPRIVPGTGNSRFGLGIYKVDHPKFAMNRIGSRSLIPLKDETPTRIVLRPGCVVEGTLIDEKGKGVAGACVSVFPALERAVEGETFTDAQGNFRFQNIAPGNIRLQFEPGKMPWS
jgi:hypothetical protein